MRTTYNKLIRDRLPQISPANGHTYAVETLDDTAYLDALLLKLVEAAQETADAQPDQRITELADVLEVLDAIMDVTGLDIVDVRAVQAQRRAERGGFAKRLNLLWTDDV